MRYFGEIFQAIVADPNIKRRGLSGIIRNPVQRRICNKKIFLFVIFYRVNI